MKKSVFFTQTLLSMNVQNLCLKNWILNEKVILEEVNKIRKKHNFNDIFILPTTEFLNRNLIKHRQFFQNENIFFGLCEKDLYEKLSDKKSFTELC